jgi:hypothetical protein
MPTCDLIFTSPSGKVKRFYLPSPVRPAPPSRIRSASPAGSGDDNDNESLTPKATTTSTNFVDATDSETEPDSQASQADAEDVACANRSILSDDIAQEIDAPDTPASVYSVLYENQLGDPRYMHGYDAEDPGEYQGLYEY